MANKTFSNWLASLAQATVAPGDLIPVVQGGVSKRAPAGQAGGIATLDPAGKLAQPRRVLYVASANGTTESPSTTAVINNYVLPDPRLTITLDGTRYVIVHGVVPVYTDANGAFAFMRLVHSTDGGSTWNALSTYALANGSTAGERLPLSAMAVRAFNAGTYTFGISIGNPSGSNNTITAHGPYRSLLVMVVDF